ncbi:hypothetical protein [Lactiplantibacillus daowaiensis]|uniref:Uncharacterized protein n=1 Tax=Lactiplantibacillus daowaiensis TaxID=2559918 RepID=A0ABW1RWK3_9LACO|nr:hypothetical protein [Lactiplantibacillus daowaiensis]
MYQDEHHLTFLEAFNTPIIDELLQYLLNIQGEFDYIVTAGIPTTICNAGKLVRREFSKLITTYICGCNLENDKYWRPNITKALGVVPLPKGMRKSLL